MTTKTLAKSPLNYVGGKYKLLPQILPLFPRDINTFVDVFAGGGNVAVNVDAKYTVINDKQAEVIALLEYLYSRDINELLTELDGIIEEYGLSKTNAEGFSRLRTDYNNGRRSEMMFYALVTHAFNNQIRFNGKGEYNMPFGKNRSSFNPKLRERFIEFHETLDRRSAYFDSVDFRNINYEELGANDLVYCDPPYLISTAAYNEQGGWTTQDEKDLLALLDELNERGVRFALSNVLTHKGNVNEILTEWSRKYTVHKLNYNYANCNYQTKQSAGDTLEVLVTNYPTEVSE